MNNNQKSVPVVDETKCTSTRRVFQIDVGNLLPHEAVALVQRIKNELHRG